MKSKFLSAKFRASVRSGSKKVTRAGLGALAFAVLLHFAPSGEAANTADNYIGSNTGNLLTPGNWSLTAAPTVSNDAVFTSSSNGTGIRTLSNGSLTVGSFDVTATTGTFTIRNGTDNTTSTITLGGTGDLTNGLSGAAAADLLYNAAAGSVFTFTGVNGTNSVLNLLLGQSGNFDAVGAMNISSVISDGSNGYSLTKTGTGVLTLTGVNTYTGATNVSAGTLQLLIFRKAKSTGYGMV